MDEQEIVSLGWDHQNFLIDGKPFIPDLSEEGNTLLVRLPCQPHEDLQWTIPDTAKRLLWEFDLGLHRPFFPLEDELHFQSLLVALKHFSNTIWPQVKERSLGGILYRGSALFGEHFLWTDSQKEQFAQGGEESKNIFCRDAFSSYFQLLAHSLPDEMPLALCFDMRQISSRAEMLNLVSKERFEHFLLMLRTNQWPIPTLCWDDRNIWVSCMPKHSLGVCLPQTIFMRKERLLQFDQILDRLDAEGIAFRVIYEDFLSEQWEGLDEIYVCFPDVLSLQAQRKLQGFCAAGGKVLKEVRGRGI
jgi:hypothetical protein